MLKKMLLGGGFVVVAVFVMFVALVSVSSAEYTTISVQSVDVDGITPVYSDAVSGGIQFVNNGRVMIHVLNTNASTRNITITTTYSEDGIDLEDVSFTIAATTGKTFAGPFSTKLFNNSSGMVQVSFSAVTDVDIAALKLP